MITGETGRLYIDVAKRTAVLVAHTSENLINTKTLKLIEAHYYCLQHHSLAMRCTLNVAGHSKDEAWVAMPQEMSRSS
jgi:hypothetical protein